MNSMDALQGITYNNTIFTQQGGTSSSQGTQKLKEDLAILLMQERGRFYPDPEFGCELYKYMFEPITEGLAKRMRTEIADTISRYYPQLNLINIDITSYDNSIEIKIQYSYTDSGRAEDELSLSLFNEVNQ
ncbi:MAG: GPW/gp25 family protein [Bacilli bacterium]|nr:GPW/gp25 family protein [Bacilli bacterium]